MFMTLNSLKRRNIQITMSELDTNPLKWNPAASLQIISRYSAEVFCMGRARSHGNARCRVRIEKSARENAVSLLEEMSSKPPTEAIHFLRKLAQQLLCNEWHKDQEDDLVAEWTEIIEPIISAYRHAEKWKRKSDRLEQRLAERDDKLARYERLKGEVHTLTLQRRDEEKKFQAMTSEASKQTEDIKAQLSAEQQRSQQLQVLLDESESKNKDLVAQMEDVQQSMREAQAEAAGWKTDAHNQAIALKAAQEDLGTQQEVVDKANIRGVELAEQLDKSQNALEATKQALVKSDKTVEELKLSTEALTVAHSTEKSRLQQRIQRLETELSRSFQNVTIRWMIGCFGYGSSAMKRLLAYCSSLVYWLLQFIKYVGRMRG
jgi:chromosome segregation ATPase